MYVWVFETTEFDVTGQIERGGLGRFNCWSEGGGAMKDISMRFVEGAPLRPKGRGAHPHTLGLLRG